MKFTTHNKLNILTSEPGYKITQASEDIEPIYRIFTDKLYLGKYDLPGNYKEIPDEEAYKMEEEIKILLENPEKQEN
jgi:hypothetical protein